MARKKVAPKPAPKKRKPRKPRSKTGVRYNQTPPDITEEKVGYTPPPGALASGEGAKGQLVNTHIRRHCQELLQCMRAGVFSEEQSAGVLAQMGAILASKASSPREKVAAAKVIQAQGFKIHDAFLKETLGPDAIVNLEINQPAAEEEVIDAEQVSRYTSPPEEEAEIFYRSLGIK